MNKELEKEINRLIDLIRQTEVSDYEAISYLKGISDALKKSSQYTTSKQGKRINYIFFKKKFIHLPFLFLLKKSTRVIIGVLLIILGVAMIITPAPFPAFEIATIYYFNPQDGITVMDLISLLIIFYGIHGIIETLLKEM